VVDFKALLGEIAKQSDPALKDDACGVAEEVLGEGWRKWVQDFFYGAAQPKVEEAKPEPVEPRLRFRRLEPEGPTKAAAELLEKALTKPVAKLKPVAKPTTPSLLDLVNGNVKVDPTGWPEAPLPPRKG
jgi:hypothetical protein